MKDLDFRNGDEFLIYKSNKEIMTYFIPSNPIKYWDLQKEKYSV
jgi:hypothetical protein